MVGIAPPAKGVGGSSGSADAISIGSGPGCGGDAVAGELDGQFHRLDHRAGFSPVPAGDSEGGPMVGTGSKDGQAEGDVDGLVPTEQFHRGEPLVVIHGHHEVVFATGRVDEEGVGGIGSMSIDTMLTSDLDRRGDDPFFLVTKQPVFSGMWIQSTYRDAGSIDSEVAAEFVAEIDRFVNAADGEDVLDVHQGQVGRGKDHPKSGRDKCHCVSLGPGSGGKQFGMSGPAKTSHRPRLLAYRCGHDRIKVTGMGVFQHGVGNRGFDELL